MCHVSVQVVQACTNKSPETGKIPLATVSLRTAGEALIMFVDSIIGQVHEGRLQVAGLEVQHTYLILCIVPQEPWLHTVLTAL